MSKPTNLLSGSGDVGFMEKVFESVHEFQKLGLIYEWAVSGSFAAYAYIRPTQTDDVDLMVVYPGTGFIIDPSPLFKHAVKMGYPISSGDHITIQGVPLQFLPAGTPLEEDALSKARCFCFGKTSVKFLGPEHLMAIMIQVGRTKDHERLLMMLNDAEYDHDKFDELVVKFGLSQQWRNFVEKYGWKSART